MMNRRAAIPLAMRVEQARSKVDGATRQVCGGEIRVTAVASVNLAAIKCLAYESYFRSQTQMAFI